MANVSSVGIGSGVLTSDLIDQLVSAERTPTEKRLDAKQESVTAELSLFAKLQSAVTDLRLPARTLSNAGTFSELTVNSGSSAFTATASLGAVAGNYTLEVESLAKAQSLSSGTIVDRDATVIGEGKLRFTIDGTITDITIDSTNNTLEGIAAAINESSAEASATIINNGNGYQLVITSNKPGAANAIDISVTDNDGGNLDGTGLSQLSYTSGVGGQQLTQNQGATDALFKFNGIPITRSSNTVDDLVEGLTITLQGTNKDAPASLKVEPNTENIVEKVQDFIEKYNALRELIVENSQIDPENPAAAGLLVGDGATRIISSQIRSILGRPISGLENDPIRGLAEIGISTNRETGNLIFNEQTFRSQLAASPESVAALFSEQGRTSDGQIEFVGSSANTKPGTYNINITQIATKGELVASSALAATTVIDADNDTFVIGIDGNTSQTITLSAGSYSAEQLVAEIQSKIDADPNLAAKNAGLKVSLDGSGALTFTSNSYGSSSKIEILSLDTNTSATLGLSLGGGTAGLDVAGTIDGVVATGKGQTLSGAVGSDVEGLILNINGGALGSRGTASYIEGIGEKLVDVINNFLSENGTITAKNERLNAELDRIAESRAKLDQRLLALETRLVRQFTAADLLIARLNSTQDFIKGQLDALTASNKQE